MMLTKHVISKPIDIEFDITLKKYSTNIKQWLKPVIDLSNFHVYPTNGITEGLTYWMSKEKRLIYREIGDYEWVDSTGKDIYYITCPSSKDGNFRDIPTDVPVALDIAYIGSTQIQKIPISDNIEYVFYSLSKPFGLNSIRTGWIFTRKPDVKLYRLTKARYYNHYANSVAENVIAKYPIDIIYKYYHDEQLKICNKFNFEPSDCVWLGTTKDKEYKDYFRMDRARICLTNYYENKSYI